jgi:putative ABC transport system permease protein
MEESKRLQLKTQKTNKLLFFITMKFFDILKRSLKSLSNSKLRTILTVMAIIVGAFTLSLTTGLGEGVKKAIDAQVSMVGFKNGLVITAKSTGASSSSPNANEPTKYDPNKDTRTMIKYMSEDDFNKIKQINGVESLTKLYTINSEYINTSSSDKYEISLSSVINNLDMNLVAGEKLLDNDSGKILITEKYVKALGFSDVGDSINKKVQITFKTALGESFTNEYTIKGIIPNSFINNGASFIDLSDSETLNSRIMKGSPLDGKYVGFIGTFPANYSSEELLKLKSELDKAGYTAQTLDDQIAMIKGVITGLQIVLGIFGAIAILASTFGIVNTLLMSVYERVKEIGLMKALGMSSGTVFLLFSIEASLLGFLGGVFGVLFAIGVGAIGNYIFHQQKLFGLEGSDILSFNVIQMCLIVGALTLISLLAGVLPAIKAAKLDPIVALASE